MEKLLTLLLILSKPPASKPSVQIKVISVSISTSDPSSEKGDEIDPRKSACLSNVGPDQRN